MSWKRVRGHEAQAEAFARAVRRGRLAHAYLFVGPPGVGKRLFAVELAKALLCEGPHDDGRLEACDHCPSCAQVDAGTHPDFLTAARPPEKAEFPIELMRELCQHFSLKAARGRGKIVVIDDADDLNDESANCFLKTLEEPPPGSVLILIGTSTDRQKATIVSRCQVVRFQPPPPEAVAEVLQANGVEDAAVRERLVRLGGGPGPALALADPALWEFRDTLLTGSDGAALRRRRAVEGMDRIRPGRGERGGASPPAGAADAAAADRLPPRRALLRAERAGPGRGGTGRCWRRWRGGRTPTRSRRCWSAAWRRIFRSSANVGTALVLEALLDAFAQRTAA